MVEYAYSGAPRGAGRSIGGMLWSDPRDEPPEELRAAERMVRRAGFVVALAMVLAMGVIGLGLL